jgi:hypothetical protein
MAQGRRRRRIPGLAALVAALICGAAGAAMIGYGAAHPMRVAEKPAIAQILSVSNCNRGTCGYRLAYMDASGAAEQATIPGSPDNQPGAGATVAIYYQVAHPSVARFSNGAYANNPSDELIGFGVVLVLLAVILAIYGIVRLIAAAIRARRGGGRPADVSAADLQR